jgi:hypothetical protein
LQEGLTNLWDDLGSEADDLGNNMQERISEIFGNVSEHLTDSLSEELDGIFKEAIENVVTALAEEIAESLTMMATGAGITSAISPLLPLIVAAKVTLGIIKTILNPFGL